MKVRILGCGTLVVESAGEHGQEQLQDIPHVEATQRELTNLISNVGTHGTAEDDDDEADAGDRRRK